MLRSYRFAAEVTFLILNEVTSLFWFYSEAKRLSSNKISSVNNRLCSSEDKEYFHHPSHFQKYSVFFVNWSLGVKIRRSHRMCSRNNVFLNFSQNSQENRPATLFKKRHWHRCFLVNFTKLFRTPSYIKHLRWLLLFLLLLSLCTHSLLHHSGVIFNFLFSWFAIPHKRQKIDSFA